MLMANQRSDKLAAARIDFTERGMLQGDLLDNVLEELRKLLHMPVPIFTSDRIHQGTSKELLIPLKTMTQLRMNLKVAITNMFCLQELQMIQ
jgi:hypothetical protein